MYLVLKLDLAKTWSINDVLLQTENISGMEVGVI